MSMSFQFNIMSEGVKMENTILSWDEILKDLHMSDEDLRKIFTVALETEHMCEVMGYNSRADGCECPCCHETLFKAEYLGDFVCRDLNKKYYNLAD